MAIDTTARGTYVPPVAPTEDAAQSWETMVYAWQVVIHPAVQIRVAGEDEAWVTRIKDSMQAGRPPQKLCLALLDPAEWEQYVRPLTPKSLWMSGEAPEQTSGPFYLLYNGHHTMAAARQLDRQRLPAQITRMSWAEAMLQSGEANLENGLPLSKDDLKELARRMYLYQLETNRINFSDIARKVGVSTSTISRNWLPEWETEETERPDTITVVRKTGETYELPRPGGRPVLPSATFDELLPEVRAKVAKGLGHWSADIRQKRIGEMIKGETNGRFRLDELSRSLPRKHERDTLIECLGYISEELEREVEAQRHIAAAKPVLTQPQLEDALMQMASKGPPGRKQRLVIIAARRNLAEWQEAVDRGDIYVPIYQVEHATGRKYIIDPDILTAALAACLGRVDAEIATWADETPPARTVYTGTEEDPEEEERPIGQLPDPAVMVLNLHKIQIAHELLARLRAADDALTLALDEGMLPADAYREITGFSSLSNFLTRYRLDLGRLRNPLQSLIDVLSGGGEEEDS
ncbi:MAG: hypothetical protein KBG20_22110 [Caldilineaceae bacterium]|nr:hypothetical protein [Caldilineaceae bacterium]